MSYSQLHQMEKGKLESIRPKMSNCSGDLAFMPDHEFVELVWENGQILMQGQSSRTRKSPSCTIFSPHTSKAQEKDGGDTVTPNIGRFGTAKSVLDDFKPPGPSSHMGMGQDDDMVPWLNYSLDDSLQHDFFSEFYSEVSGVNLNVSSTQTTDVPIYKNSSYGHLDRDSHMVSGHYGESPESGNASKVVGGGLEPSKSSRTQLCSSLLQQCQTSVPSLKSRVSDLISSNTNNVPKAPFRNSSQTLTTTGNLPNTKLHKQDPGPTRTPQHPSDNKAVMNFSHFSRPLTLVKANLRSTGATTSPGLWSIDKLRSKGKVSATTSSNPFESRQIKSTNGSRSATGLQSQLASVPTEMDLKLSMSKPPKELLSAEHSEIVYGEDVSGNNISLDQALGQTSSFAASTTLGRSDSEKVVEPAIASSSVCSGNSTGGASNDLRHTMKRKSQDSEESEYQSEDVEEESEGVRRPAPTRGGTGAKRSRAAEVHNLSERRRRDRINEKMRALQELIPNCNKVDKASMLDEAIEYLKTLQLQIQIMSMGSGLCMPPMMLQAGLQHIHAPHMAHFSPMGVGMGMGMGMGFGMGMVDMRRGSYGFLLNQAPPMHGLQFPCPPVSGPTNFIRMAGSSLQMFGLSGQGLPLPMPHSPFIPSSGSPTKPISVPDVSGVVAMEVPDSGPPSSTKDSSPMTHKTSCQKTSADCSQSQKSTQSALVKRNDPAPHDSGNGAINSSNGDRII